MTVQNLATARFVLQCLLEELEEYDRCIPVARNVQAGDVTDALLTVLSNRELERLAMPKKARTALIRRRRVSAAADGVKESWRLSRRAAPRPVPSHSRRGRGKSCCAASRRDAARQRSPASPRNVAARRAHTASLRKSGTASRRTR